MTQKLAIVAFAVLGIACFAAFFVLRQQPPDEIAEPKLPQVVTLQLDTSPLGKISPCASGLVAGNMRGELRVFSYSDVDAPPQIFQLSKYDIMAPVLEYDGLYHVGDTNGTFWVFDPATETVKWSYRTANQITGRAAVHDGMLFVGSHDYDFYAFDHETGELLFTVECGDQVNAAPVVSQRANAVFFGNCDGFLRKIDVAAKSLGGTIDLESHIPENLALRDETVYALTHQGVVAAVDCETFETIYRVKTPDDYLSSPYATESFLFLTDARGNIHVHSRHDGTRLTTLQTPGAMTALQAGDDSRVFAVSEKGKLYRWQRDGDQWYATQLADLQTDCDQGCVLAGNRLYVADKTGGLFCVEVMP